MSTWFLFKYTQSTQTRGIIIQQQQKNQLKSKSLIEGSFGSLLSY